MHYMNFNEIKVDYYFTWIISIITGITCFDTFILLICSTMVVHI